MNSHRDSEGAGRLLDPLTFPLHGARLIEASAGTGKTWTIAALYLRLVLGHGGETGFRAPGEGAPGEGAAGVARALTPPEILVMTFTRAATRELSNRVRERLIEAAAYFRAPPAVPDPYLQALLDSYPGHGERDKAAHRLSLAADTMDEAAIFTIDAWCQRMLREHAFDSGSLFDEELLSDEQALFDDAANDYWRQQVYPLDAQALPDLLACWPDVGALKKTLSQLVKRAGLLEAPPDASVAGLITRVRREQGAVLAELKSGWGARAERMEHWIAGQRAAAPKCFNGVKMKPETLVRWFAGLRAWAGDAALVQPPDINQTAWRRLTPDGIADAFSKGYGAPAPDDFAAFAALAPRLAALTPLTHLLYRHAATRIAARMAELKLRARQFGFADLQQRLLDALAGENGAALRQRIVNQYPLAMVDEFQDTAPDQYRILDLLYRVAANEPRPGHGLLLIGDPKQSIYGFRGADIGSYLAARAATAGRHYQLGTNYRSTAALVGAVNTVFLQAEAYPRGAFRFRRGDGPHDNPLPFDAVAAQGRPERLVDAAGAVPAMLVSCSAATGLKKDDYRALFAQRCAEHIVGLLNDARAGFESGDNWTALQPADIAVLVRDRTEAAAMRQALARRGVRSVYLSDRDSVLDSDEAADVLRWLHALANPLDGALARAAFATPTIGLSLAELAQLSNDELAWEQRLEQLKNLHLLWQRQGVLAMLRRFIHELDLPASLLNLSGGERRLTNLLHLAELLQEASRQLDGEQALIRWLAEQIAGSAGGGDERVLRLESDAELVKVITVHKSKGLEYPLVYLPFAVAARRIDRRNRSFFECAGAEGEGRLIDLSLSDAAQQAMEAARIEEDLRLLYVALTRARHFLWLGVAAVSSGKSGGNTLHESALGYLLNAGERLPAEQVMERLHQWCAGNADIVIDTPSEPDPGSARARPTMLKRVEQAPALVPAALFTGRFERDWSVGSFTSLTRQSSPLAVLIQAPQRASEETLLEDGQGNLGARTAEAPWHRFPRGAVPGNFLHEQLEWLAGEGFASTGDAQFASRLGARCARAGWAHRQDDTVAWLTAIARTPLPLLEAPLSAIGTLLTEMEFWFPSERLGTEALERLCARHLLGDAPRPALPKRQLHGMLKGFADLVFEHAGRYWVIDYKSNALGADDGAYHHQALAGAMAQHRYDIQGALYMLALHRLLRSRLGDDYDPATQLGGALFLFLRGIGNTDTRGCHWLPAHPALLSGLDDLFNQGASEPAPGNKPGETHDD